MKIAITGGSGFIGQEMALQLQNSASRIVILSRGEAKQASMKRMLPEYPSNIMRYMIGDVRDQERLIEAFRCIDYVIHAAALKRVEVCEYDPEEAFKTNVLGTANVVKACHKAGVKKCILTSTDKACQPDTAYGSMKLTAERLFIAGNNLGKCRFSVCRYANVIGSTGSVIPLWKKQVAEKKPITITDNRMTRMWIPKWEAAMFVLSKFSIMQGGELFIPDLKGKTMLQLADELFPNYPKEEIGMRPNEKLHEALISEVDARDCWYNKENGSYYTIYPQHHSWTTRFKKDGKKMPEDFYLRSDS